MTWYDQLWWHGAGKSIHSYNPAPAATSSIDKEVQETESTTPSKSDVESQSPNFS